MALVLGLPQAHRRMPRDSGSCCCGRKSRRCSGPRRWRRRGRSPAADRRAVDHGAQRNPRRGTALDKIYGFHIENGSIEAYVQELRERVAAKADDGTGWMVLGLVGSQRGWRCSRGGSLDQSGRAAARRSAGRLYLGQSLVLVGQTEKAIAAFEQAIERARAGRAAGNLQAWAAFISGRSGRRKHCKSGRDSKSCFLAMHGCKNRLL